MRDDGRRRRVLAVISAALTGCSASDGSSTDEQAESGASPRVKDAMKALKTAVTKLDSGGDRLETTPDGGERRQRETRVLTPGVHADRTRRSMSTVAIR